MSDRTEPAARHMLTRTNPKGVPFIGRCRLCGEEGLPAEAVSFPCPGGMGRSYAGEFAKVILGDHDA